ncbi:MAG: shikimate dehydrogenase [Endomicrobia bacterium]|nr:shikimate dehydrogenase [Endomicrobiia bacterium]MCX7940282.1 shikimate dehydrogenase [Endomicrobiia bacterium]MDW8055814.1 shikimate dehydrogenase [Elusimicrobiota bacterium]
MNLVNSETGLLGIIGYPVKHSFSPMLHTSLAQKYGLNFVYLAFEILPENFKYFKEVVLTLNIEGLNITIPYKEKVISYLHKVDKLAKHIGAVNTVVNKGGELIGYNTDIYGFTHSLSEVTLKGEDVLVIGCGGVSRAIVCGLQELGVKKVYVYDIDKNKMLLIKKQFEDFIVLLKEEQIDTTIPDVKMLVNATPLGMKENDLSPLRLDLITKEHIVYDVVYNRETELVKHAKQIGCKHVFDGVPMFVYQAVESFFLWTGVKADEKFMFDLVRKFLNRNH